MTGFLLPSAQLAQFDDTRKRQSRRSRIGAGFLVTLCLHGLVLWLLLRQHPQLIKPLTDLAAGQMVFIMPQQKPANKPKAQKKPAKQEFPSTALPSITMPQPAIPDIPPPEVTPPPTAAAAPPPPADDMMAQIEAARRRRAQAQPQQQAAQEEDDNARGIRIAQANIAGLQAAAAGRDEHGGIFQIKNLGVRRAAFSFRGWNTNFRRNWNQLIEVELGDDQDIETAIVKRMIEVIRKYKQDDFVWNSHRLGKHVTLNARPEYTRELQQFLMREFFPDHQTARLQ